MNLDELLITWFCLIDGLLLYVTEGHRLRQSGPSPVLADSEVLTMEVVRLYLGLSQDKALFTYFRRHWTMFFPALTQVPRTIFVRQAANLRVVKERLWCAIRDTLLSYDPTVSIIDSFPLSVCQFARAYRCRRFRGEASYGKDTLIRQTFCSSGAYACRCRSERLASGRSPHSYSTYRPLSPVRRAATVALFSRTNCKRGSACGDGPSRSSPAPGQASWPTCNGAAERQRFHHGPPAFANDKTPDGTSMTSK